MREFSFWVNYSFEEQHVMQRLETYSTQNTRMCWINEESHRIKTYNINVLKGHFFVCVNLLIIYLGLLEFFFSQQILINNYLLLFRLINEQIM